jgi:hypothetical protein
MCCVSCDGARFLLIPVLAAFTSVAFGQGGPPLLTDDPGTPGNRNWEINFASMLVFIREQRFVQAPLLDVNYGLGDRIQLKYQASYIWGNDGIGRYRGAMGNSLIGVKWRYYQQSREGGWNVSTYPQLEINNPGDSYARGLVELGPRFLLPVEVTRKFGPLDVNFEGGYWFNRRAANERILGLAFGHQFTKRFEGLAEVYDDVLLGGTLRSTTFDFGGRYEFHHGLLFLFMAGRSFGEFSGRTSGQPYFIGYFGLQVQLTHGPRKKHPNSTTSTANN